MVDFVATGSIIIDDLIDPAGRSTMGLLGGGASHTVAGMRVWSDRTAIVAAIGESFPPEAWAQLSALADVSAIVQRPVPQPRFWQLFETDGTRHEVPRTDLTTFKQMTIQPHEYPTRWAGTKAVYTQAHRVSEAESWVRRWRALNPNIVILWEPWEIFCRPENLDAFCQLAPLFDIISPQTVEIGWMLQETDPRRQATMLFEGGVRCLALRMGADGALVGQKASELHYLPAPTVDVVDETGAGNAFCGGFLVGYVEGGGDPLLAGRYGTVSATFTLEQVGLPHLGKNTRQLAEARLKTVQAK